ncbi:MAG: T9SS type A sorting domain-containing protein [Flavobacteriales bacterium]|nr:T9SS type A sorting domain-containing protein [Flavobacteriales bacterium]
MKKLLLSFTLLLAAGFSASAQCLENFNGGIIATGTGYDAGQSFTAPCSGVLNYVQVTAMTAGTIPAGTLKIYAGNGTGTTPIYTQAHGAITLAQPGPIQIMITGNVPITNASQYTFEIYMTLDVNAGTGYAGGEAYQSGTSVDPLDVDFEVDIALATGINEVNTSSTTVFPNPATNVLNITTDDQIETVSIYSINGALVKTGNQKTINVSNLDKGMYIITVQTDKGVTRTRFTKE